ncbi:MAG: ATP-binding protein [bacterium]
MSETNIIENWESPAWLEELNNVYNANASHMFLLYFNVNDFIYVPGKGKLSLREFLTMRLALKYDIILFYCQSAGITYPEGLVPKKDILKRFALPIFGAGEEEEPEKSDEERLKNLSTESRKVVEGFGRQARQSQDETFRDPKKVFPNFEHLLLQKEHRTAIVIEYVDKLLPAGTQDKDAIILIETLQRWASNYKIRQDTGNIVLLVTPNLGAVHPDIYSHYGCKAIKIDRPDAKTRLAFLRFLSSEKKNMPEEKSSPSSEEVSTSEKEKVPGEDIPTLEEVVKALEEIKPKIKLEEGTTLEGLAEITAGFNLKDLDYLFNSAKALGINVSYDLVKEKKKEIIEAESNNLLEVMEPKHGFDSIGGLDHVKKFLEEKVADIKRYFEQKKEIKDDNILLDIVELLPKGILLVGPPGTGKTILAEALAKEATMNLVKMKDIRSMWVGESERNLSKVFDILLALSPVVVFVDEVDQAFGSRMTDSRDSGVSQRIFAKILTFMSDNSNRGKIIWVAATNRPDVLDQAMLRRFDKVIPLLPPDKEDRKSIFEVMEKKVKIEYDDGIDFDFVTVETEGLTGSAIEVIVRRAAEYAKTKKVNIDHLKNAIADFKPNHDPLIYDYQSLLALEATNFYSMLPLTMPQWLSEIIEEVKRTKTNAPLRQKIRELEAQIRGV